MALTTNRVVGINSRNKRRVWDGICVILSVVYIRHITLNDIPASIIAHMEVIRQIIRIRYRVVVVLWRLVVHIIV